MDHDVKRRRWPRREQILGIAYVDSVDNIRGFIVRRLAIVIYQHQTGTKPGLLTSVRNYIFPATIMTA